ncbi:MAG TPA: hypothetical protein VHF58_03745 [Solirubrobacterales bacterium]|nr:hypothetical protein [Solirubrobacterales bacterium]
MRKKGTRIALTLAAIASLALVVPASAGPGVKSTLKIKQINATGASGTLKSKEAKCQKRRKVALKFSGEYTPVKVGTDKTNKKGRWSIDVRLDDEGFYFATTAPAKRGKVKCRGAESKSVRFNG